jgi:hypothetical protein
MKCTDYHQRNQMIIGVFVAPDGFVEPISGGFTPGRVVPLFALRFIATPSDRFPFGAKYSFSMFEGKPEQPPFYSFHLHNLQVVGG